MKRLIGIMQFMTRIPIPIDTGLDEDFYKGMVYFPIVGLVLGMCYGIVAYMGVSLFNPFIGAVLVVASTMVLTGGLHLDGLGDSFDGLYSYRDKDRILEIMKDSRLGTNGLLAILIVVLLKIGLITSFLEEGIIWPVVVMPIVARSLQVVASYRTCTPRKTGMGNIFIGKIKADILVGTLLMMVILQIGITWVAGDIQVIQQVLVSGLLIGWVRLYIRNVYQKIEGITGDILGCICELGEVGYLLLMYLVISR